MKPRAFFRGMFVAFMVLVFDCRAAETNNETAVQVFFEGGATLSTKALENIGRAELAKRGVTNVSGFNCSINLSMRGTNKGAFVLFTKGFGRPYHQVNFDAIGRLSSVHSGTMMEFIGDGTSPTTPSGLDSTAVLEIARKAVAANDKWIDRAEFGNPKQRNDGSWLVTVWRLPKTPGGFRDITIGADGKVLNYVRGY